jgi:hypothetical protein
MLRSLKKGFRTPSPAAPRRPRSRRRDAEESKILVSSNVDQGLSFEQALRRAQSRGHDAFRKLTDQVVEQIGLRGKGLKAVGDWEDGAEPSLVNLLAGPPEPETLRYVGAWYGLLGYQRAVFLFRPSPQGPDSVYQIQVPETNVGTVRALASRHGIPFRTFVPGRKGTRILIYDEQRALRHRVSKLARAYGVGARETLGSGEYLGGGSRAEARACYRKILAEHGPAPRRRRGLHVGARGSHFFLAER